MTVLMALAQPAAVAFITQFDLRGYTLDKWRDMQYASFVDFNEVLAYHHANGLAAASALVAVIDGIPPDLPSALRSITTRTLHLHTDVVRGLGILESMMHIPGFSMVPGEGEIDKLKQELEHATQEISRLRTQLNERGRDDDDGWTLCEATEAAANGA